MQKGRNRNGSCLIFFWTGMLPPFALVDSNLHWEKILPSERTFAYKLKMEAMNHQGRTSGQIGLKPTTVSARGRRNGKGLA